MHVLIAILKTILDYPRAFRTVLQAQREGIEGLVGWCKVGAESGWT